VIRIDAAPLIVIAAVLVGLKLLVLWIEPRMAFYPIRGVQESPALACLEFENIMIPTADGERLHAWWLEARDARAQVVFFHGNGGNLSLWLDAIVGIRQHACSVLAVDFRGYGSSTGRPSEAGLYRDAEAAIQLFANRLRKPGSPVVYWGRSIGTPVAAHAAARLAPDAVILESPMPDVRSLLRTNPVLWLFSFFSSYRFPTARLVTRYSGPLLVIHGDADSIVPYSAGRRVFEAAATNRKAFVTIAGADHNDLHLVNPRQYWDAIQTFLSGVASRAR
jgi:fermentation-respiration switch protein FrsA (DUF1100 family)